MTDSAGKRLSAKDKQRHKYSTLRREMTIAANAAGTQLLPWHKTLALWMAGEVIRPKPDQILAAAVRITRGTVTKANLKTLLSNPAFQAFKLQVEEEDTAKARAIMESRMPEAVSHHFTALDELMKEGKWDKVYHFTEPILKRIWPEDAGPKLPAQIITINLGGNFVKSHQGKLDQAVDITAVTEIVEEG